MIETVVSVLSDIQVANGYNTDAGLNVTKEPAQVPSEANGPVLAVVMDTLQPGSPAGGTTTRNQVIVIFAKIAGNDEIAQLNLHALIDDVEQAMAKKAVPYPPQTTRPKFLSAQNIAAADGLDWVGAEIRYTGGYIPVTR